MNDSLSDALKEAYALAPAGQVIINTLEIRQDGVQDPIYLAQSRSDVVAQDENGNTRTFLASGFQFALPPSNKEGLQSLNIAVDDINRQASDFVTRAKAEEEPVQIIYRPYLSTDLTQPQMDPPLVLFLKDVEKTVLQVTGRATFMDIINKRAPSELYTRERFPSLG
jgi:Domain of unknown function (DUF1833)